MEQAVLSLDQLAINPLFLVVISEKCPYKYVIANHLARHNFISIRHGNDATARSG